MSVAPSTREIITGAVPQGPVTLQVPFAVRDAAVELAVGRLRNAIRKVLSYGVEWTWTPASSGPGGTVLIIGGAAAGDRYAVTGDFPALRSADIPASQRYSSAQHNRELDRIWMSLQEMQRRMERSLSWDAFTSATDGIDLHGRPLTNLGASGAASSAARQGDLDQLAQTLANQVGAINGFNKYVLPPSALDPVVGNSNEPLERGMQYFNTVTGQLRIYDGVAWAAQPSPPDGSISNAKVAANAAIDVAKTAFYNAPEFAVARDLQSLLRDQYVSVEALKLGSDPDDTNAMLRAVYRAGLENKPILVTRVMTISSEILIQPTRNAQGRIINNPPIVGLGMFSSGFRRAAGYNGHLIRFGFIDSNDTSGSGFKPAQPILLNLGFFHDTNGTATIGDQLHFADGNAVAPNFGYGYGPIAHNIYIEGSPENGLYVGLRRNWSHLLNVIGVYTRKHPLQIKGGGDHRIWACSFGNNLLPGYDATLLDNVFSTVVGATDFHDATQASGLTIISPLSYVRIFGGTINGNGQNGVRLVGGNALSDKPCLFTGVMMTDNSRDGNGTSHNYNIDGRARVQIMNPIFLPSTPPPSPAPFNLPGFHVGLNGLCGDVIFEGYAPGGANCVAIGVSNRPLDLTNCGQAETLALTQANVTTASGSLTSATGSLVSIRRGHEIHVTQTLTIPTNGTGSGDIRLPLSKGPILRTRHVVGGVEQGIFNSPVMITCGAGLNVAQLRLGTAGLGYPGGTNAALQTSFSYELAPNPS